LTVSTATVLPETVRAWLSGHGIPHRTEPAEERAAHAASSGQRRARQTGGSATELAGHTDGSPAVAIYANEVVSAGRVELLTFLREQAVSITAHRFGTPRHYEVPMLAPAK